MPTDVVLIGFASPGPVGRRRLKVKKSRNRRSVFRPDEPLVEPLVELSAKLFPDPSVRSLAAMLPVQQVLS
jgi:hypothetical protein